MTLDEPTQGTLDMSWFVGWFAETDRLKDLVFLNLPERGGVELESFRPGDRV